MAHCGRTQRCSEVHCRQAVSSARFPPPSSRQDGYACASKTAVSIGAKKNLVVDGGRGQGTEESVLRGGRDPRSRAENGEEHMCVVLHRVLVWTLDSGLHSTHGHRLCLRHCHAAVRTEADLARAAGPILVKPAKALESPGGPYKFRKVWCFCEDGGRDGDWPSHQAW